MLPEISRRCLVCGASARAGARFCPQCGDDLLAREAAEAADGAGRDGGDSPPSRGAAQTGELREAETRGAAEIRDAAETRRAAEAGRAGHGAGPDARGGERGAAPGGRGLPPTGEVGATPAPREWGDVPPPRDRPGLTPPAPAADAGGVGLVQDVVPDVVPGAAPGAATAGDEGGAFPEGPEDVGASEGGAEGSEAGAGGRRERAAARVRGVKENLRPRVERIRDDALVALEDAPADSDSGLRFVIIAVVLFLLFILFLVVSVYVLG